MKKLAILLVSLLLLTACGTEQELIESTATTEVIEESGGMKKTITTETVETAEIEESEDTEITDEVIEDETASMASDLEPITFEQIEAIVLDNTGINDKLIAFDVTDGNIHVEIDMAPDELFPPEDLAIARYTVISDELLYYNGWTRLTMEFVGTGIISVDTSEAEMNEYGVYFPAEAIEEDLY